MLILGLEILFFVVIAGSVGCLFAGLIMAIRDHFQKKWSKENANKHLGKKGD